MCNGWTGKEMSASSLQCLRHRDRWVCVKCTGLSSWLFNLDNMGLKQINNVCQVKVLGWFFLVWLVGCFFLLSQTPTVCDESKQGGQKWKKARMSFQTTERAVCCFLTSDLHMSTHECTQVSAAPVWSPSWEVIFYLENCIFPDSCHIENYWFHLIDRELKTLGEFLI